MDPTMVATQALALLSPYIVRAGDAAAQKLGEAAAKNAEAILDLIRRRFGADQDTYGEQTLAKVLEKPNEQWPKEALKDQLVEKAQNDASFRNELESLVQTAKRDPESYQFTVNVSGGSVGTINQYGKVGEINSGA